MAAQDIEFGLDSFVAVTVDDSGQELSGDTVIRNTLATESGTRMLVLGAIAAALLMNATRPLEHH